MSASNRAIGIEYLNIYGGRAYVTVDDIFDARGLDKSRAANLMMRSKAVGMPYEDSVTNAVNAAKPIIDQLSDSDRDAIELLITASESGLDFGKSLATWVHKYLGLPPRCRVFEVKQACYGGTAALQMAAGHLKSSPNPNAKALVIATDMARPSVKLSYAEPSQGVAAAAVLVGSDPVVLDLDHGATGIHSFEVLDTCRPDPDVETGDPDLSLMSYMDCLNGAVADYMATVEGADFKASFDYLAFHTPFAGMVKGAHRNLLRRTYKDKPADIDADFDARVTPSLGYCQAVGNAYSATIFVALASLIDTVGEVGRAYRVGLFSYGSGCCSEFYSGVVSAEAAKRQAGFDIGAHLAARAQLPVAQYDQIIDLNKAWIMGGTGTSMEFGAARDIYDTSFAGSGLLTFMGLKGYERQYEWA